MIGNRYQSALISVTDSDSAFPSSPLTLPAQEILFDHTPERLPRVCVAYLANILFYFFPLFRTEGFARPGCLRRLLPRLDLAESQRDFLDRSLPEVPVHFFHDLRFEQGELLHPGRAVHDESELFPPNGLGLGMARD